MPASSASTAAVPDWIDMSARSNWNIGRNQQGPGKSSKVPGSPGKIEKPLRINALGLFSCPATSQDIPTNRSSHCRNFCRNSKIAHRGASEFLMARHLILSSATIKGLASRRAACRSRWHARRRAAVRLQPDRDQQALTVDFFQHG
jgi:hypothetical protein